MSNCNRYTNCPPSPTDPLLGYQSAMPLASTQNLLINGGFETGDLTGWTVAGTGNVVVTIAPGYTHSGKWAAAPNGSSPRSFLTQTINTIPGVQYSFSCWFRVLSGSGGPTPNRFSVQVGSLLLYDQTNIATANFFNIGATFTATATTTTIQFGFYCPAYFFCLDDVSLVQVTVPLPTDEFIGTGFGPLTPPQIGTRFRKRTGFAIVTDPSSQANANDAAYVAARADATATWALPGQPFPLQTGDVGGCE